MHMQAVSLAALVAGAVAVPQIGSGKQQPLAGFILGRSIGATWEAVNDPVMGGVSESGFKVQGNKGVWEGEVKIVPKLQAPGFCRVNGNIGSHDLSESAGLVFKMAGRGDPSKTLMAQIETGHSDFKGQFVANLTGVSSDISSIFVPFSSFRPFGIRPEPGGAPTKAVLKHVMQVGFLADGTKGKFEIELEEVLAGNSPAPGPTPGPAPTGGLTLFEFSSSSKPWTITNDPVMGGRSHSTFKVAGGLGIFAGEVAIVPSLKAPGFCNAFAKIPSADASAYNALEIRLISKGALKTFKTSWSGKFVPKDPTCHHPGCQYEEGEFKAGFNVTGTGAMERIVVPMTDYTSSWSDFTGGCHDHGAVCCSPAHPEVCPNSKALSAITQVGIWGEGTAGQFELDIKSVRAIKLP